MKKAPRLIENFAPENYNLHIQLDRKNSKFNGQVVILGKKIGRPAKRLVFHQKDLKITGAKITKQDKKHGEIDIEIIRVNTHAKFSELRLHTATLLHGGNYTVTIDFNGKITDPMNGLYPCRFDYNGKQKTILATQFESHHAREVLPCIDEPAAKATFDVSVTADSTDEILGNMPQISSEITDNKRTVKFQRTPIMSTYLLAFVAGEMHYAEAKSKSGVIFRSWGSVAQPKSHLVYSAQEGAKILDYFCDYFKTPFPLPKCDQVALPDFDAGAMENWGLITYREVALLVDPKNRSLSSEQYVSMVVAHELSHQWFGNLVTMKWWDDLWLNESFASIMEHIALDALHPDWKQWEQYTISDVILASNRDVFKDVQPVRAEVRHPDEVSSLFDPAIVYTKGARLLYMLREYIGDQAFRNGLKDYFSKHAYQNTTHDDLWTSLHQTSKAQVKALMDPWLEQSGMPLINIKQVSKNQYEVAQKRLLLDGSDDDRVWPVPLLANQKIEPELLKTKTHTIIASSKMPVFLNINAAGHFVSYYDDQKILQQIKMAIKSKTVDPAMRVNVLNDMLLLARSGQGNITYALDVIKECEFEDRDAVWSMFGRILSQTVAFVEEDKRSEENLYILRKNLAQKWYEKLGWEDQANDDTNTRLLRHTIVGTMIAGRDAAAIEFALNTYAKLKSTQKLPAEYRGIILTTLVRHGKPDIDDLLNQYQSSANPDVQIALSSGLTEATQPEIIEKIIDKCLGKKGLVRTQDIFRWFVYFMRNPKSRPFIWQWLLNNWQRLERDMGPKMLDDLPGYAAGSLSTKLWQKKYSDFFEPKLKNPLLNRNIRIAMAEIEARRKWREREEPLLKKYLARI